jgi:hypothetical protein
MSDTPTTTPTELELLKERAEKLSIDFHPSIGLKSLKAKVNSVLAPSEDQAESEETSAIPRFSAAQQVQIDNEEKSTIAKAVSKDDKIMNECSKLVRVNIACMNPNKKEHFGELFSLANSLGRWKKFVPFNTEDGYHIPNIIYQFMKERKCQVFVNRRNAKGDTIREGKLVKEFSIEVLEPLTKTELEELAVVQAARGD